MKLLLRNFFDWPKTVTFEEVNIYHETESSILVELRDQSIWLPKKKITLIRQNGSTTLVIPLKLLRKKFPTPKYNKFYDI